MTFHAVELVTARSRQNRLWPDCWIGRPEQLVVKEATEVDL